MNYPKSADVIVVGGGPAGALAAIVVANAGKDVIILDKKKRNRIGDKTCGEALDKPAPLLFKKELGLELPHGEELTSPIEFLSFTSINLDEKLKAKTPAFLVNRLKYGQRLLREAENRGARIFGDSPVRELIIKGDQIEGVRIHRNGKLVEIRAKIVIDASGFVAVVRKNIPSEIKRSTEYEVPDDSIVATYREIVEFEDDHPLENEIVLWYREDIPIPGYAWIFTSGPKRLNLGITWPKNIPYPDGKKLKDIYHGVFDDLYPQNTYRIVHSGGGQIPIRIPFASVVFNGAMLVGDAGCFVDPTTAEGHGPALLSGYQAGKTAVKALKNGSYRREDLWEMNLVMMKGSGKTSAMSYVMQRLMVDLTPKGINKILKKNLLTQEELERIFVEENFEFSMGTKIKKTLKFFPNFLPLIKIMKAINRVEEVASHYDAYPKDPSGLDEWTAKRNSLLGVQF